VPGDPYRRSALGLWDHFSRNQGVVSEGSLLAGRSVCDFFVGAGKMAANQLGIRRTQPVNPCLRVVDVLEREVSLRHRTLLFPPCVPTRSVLARLGGSEDILESDGIDQRAVLCLLGG